MALDRAVRLAWKRSLPAPLDEWTAVRDAIHGEIFDQFWDLELAAFVQFKGSKHMDASHLLMPLVRFISPRDPRWLSTLKAVRKELATDALVHRYLNRHSRWGGLPGTEGTFSMCSSAGVRRALSPRESRSRVWLVPYWDVPRRIKRDPDSLLPAVYATNAVIGRSEL